MSVLERGGNAFDAAAAGGFVLQVVEPHLNGPGGEVPILFWDEKDRRIQALCGQGSAPALATPSSISRAEPGPGARDRLAARDGARRLRRLADAAARPRHLGTGGRAASRHRIRPQRLSAGAAHRAGDRAVQALFRDEWSSSAAWMPDGKVPASGTPVPRTPAIADTYARIRERGQRQGDRRAASTPPSTSGIAASWPAPSTSSIARRPSATRRGSAIPACCGWMTWPPGRPRYEAPVTTQLGR